VTAASALGERKFVLKKGLGVEVGVAVLVGVCVGVDVGVAVFVGVCVGVAVAVGTGAGKYPNISNSSNHVRSKLLFQAVEYIQT
jgi:hypothetical protein